jgi:glycerol uptake facilitator-like aquaporin
MGIAMTFFCLLQILGPVSGGHMNPAVTLGVFIREGKIENKGFFALLCFAQFLGAIFGAILAINALASGSDTWRRQHPNSSVPIDWVPAVCPSDPLSNQCEGKEKQNQAICTTILGSFFFVFMILLVKTPGHSPSDIPFINCAVIAGSLYAFFGCSHLLGGGLNPAVDLAVIWAHSMQLTKAQLEGDHNPSAYKWTYIIVPFIGGWLAGLANKKHIEIIESTIKVQQEKDKKLLVELNVSGASSSSGSQD